MEATLTLHQAGDRLGVDDTDLSRLIRIGALPEARKVDLTDGRVWVIPEEHLAAIASRNGWTIDLRGDGQDVRAVVSPPMPSMPSTPTTPGATQPAVAPTTPTAPTPPTRAETSTVAAAAPTATDSSIEAPMAVPMAGAPSSTTTGPAAETPTAATPGMPGSATPETMPVAEPAAGAADGAEATASPIDGSGALVPHRESVPAAGNSASIQAVQPQGPGGPPAVAEAFDLALLDRLLATHEDRVTAQVKEQEARHALAALNDTHNRTTGELDIERRERMATADRYREERRARATADAKVAELRDRLVREMAMTDSEKDARAEAIDRSLQAERDAANAVALLGWRARRRYNKLGDSGR